MMWRQWALAAVPLCHYTDKVRYGFVISGGWAFATILPGHFDTFIQRPRGLS
jgi:hypothetical protein